MTSWNPWHGCKKCGPGCDNCPVYLRDAQVGRDASAIVRTGDYNGPFRRDRGHRYKMRSDDGPVWVCRTSDFFIAEADAWRFDCWQMMKLRPDLQFHIVTRRPERIRACLPDDWGEGYGNVILYAACETQATAEQRISVLLEIPAAHRRIMAQPLLEALNLSVYLASGAIEQAVCGGDAGDRARACDYDWVTDLQRQCAAAGIAFSFRSTGAVLVRGGRTYRIPHELQGIQAGKADIDIPLEQASEETHDQWLSRDLFSRIADSPFRSRFHLRDDDRRYIRDKGMDTIRTHAADFIRARLAPAQPANDGKQTPMRGHPVFLAQHACACCCRGCLEKWHGIPAGRELTEQEQLRIVDILMEWIRRQC